MRPTPRHALGVRCRGSQPWLTNSLGIATAATSLDDAVLDRLLAIGGPVGPLLSAVTLSRIVDASNRCRRVASVCTGAFTLTAAGLLDGRRATTHWRFAARLQRDYPSIRVEADHIYCRDANIWTSAGITAGIDLALALIEEDHGFAIAKCVAQHLVVYRRRHGGQSQFAASVDLAPENDRIAAALGYARDHISVALTLEQLAEAAGMSRRQFSRAFRAQTGATPARMVERLRADLARGRIETTAEPVERVAEAVGFGDAENMRRARVWENGAPLRTKLRTLMRLKSRYDFERSPSVASRSSFPAPKEPRRYWPVECRFMSSRSSRIASNCVPKPFQSPDFNRSTA